MIRWICLGLSALVLGCTPQMQDPTQRPGTWVARGDNDNNLRAMIANPHDLVRGSGETDSRGIAAAQPIQRLDTGHRTPLIDLNATQIIPSSSAAQPEGNGNGGS